MASSTPPALPSLHTFLPLSNALREKRLLTTLQIAGTMPADASAAAAIIGNHVRSNRGRSNETDINGLSDWERLPDLPTSEELLANDSSDNLPWFPVKHAWETKAEYLEALYKILRFEGVEGLRYSVKTVRDSPNMDEDDNTCIYIKVSS